MRPFSKKNQKKSNDANTFPDLTPEEAIRSLEKLKPAGNWRWIIVSFILLLFLGLILFGFWYSGIFDNILRQNQIETQHATEEPEDTDSTIVQVPSDIRFLQLHYSPNVIVKLQPVLIEASILENGVPIAQPKIVIKPHLENLSIPLEEMSINQDDPNKIRYGLTYAESNYHLSKPEILVLEIIWDDGKTQNVSIEILPFPESMEDFDNDGLMTKQEMVWGTDPQNPDSDYDRINDDIEILKLSTNPLIPSSMYFKTSDQKVFFRQVDNPDFIYGDLNNNAPFYIVQMSTYYYSAFIIGLVNTTDIYFDEFYNSYIHGVIYDQFNKDKTILYVDQDIHLPIEILKYNQEMALIKTDGLISVAAKDMITPASKCNVDFTVTPENEIYMGNEVHIIVSGSCMSGLQMFEISVNGQPVAASQKGESPYDYSWDTENTSPGIYIIKATVYGDDALSRPAELEKEVEILSNTG